MPNGGIQPIGDAAVVGADVEGLGIALSLALGGFEVILVDSSHGKLRNAVDDMRTMLGVLEEREMVNGRTAQFVHERVTPRKSIDDDAMGQVGFAVEALSESLELKRSVLAELDRPCPTRAILASTTLSFDVSQLASWTGRPDRVVVTRWGSPPHLTSRVEVVPGSATTDKTIDLTMMTLKYIGKRPVVATVGDNSSGRVQ